MSESLRTVLVCVTIVGAPPPPNEPLTTACLAQHVAVSPAFRIRREEETMVRPTEGRRTWSEGEGEGEGEGEREREREHEG